MKCLRIIVYSLSELLRGSFLILFILLQPGIISAQSSGAIGNASYNLSQVYNIPVEFNEPVTAFAQASSGLIFMGTQQGVYAYNGLTLASLVTKENRSLMGAMSVQDLSCWNNHLWIATLNGLIKMSYNGQLNNVWRSGDRSGLPSSHLHSLFIDPDNKLWICSDNRNPVFISSGDSTFVEIPWKEFVREQGISDKVYLNTYSVCQKSEHSLWLFTNIGLFEYLIDEQIFCYHELKGSFPNSKMTAGLDNFDGVLYINMGGEGLWIYDYSCGTLQEYKQQNKVLRELDYAPPWNAVRGWDGQIWVACKDGTYCYNPRTSHWYPANFYTFQTKVYQKMTAFHLFVDRDASIWLGYLDGPFRLDPHYQQIQSIGLNDFTDQIVSAYFEDIPNKQAYVGFLGAAPLVLMNLDRPREQQPIGSFDHVVKILTTKSDQVFIVSRNELHLYNPGMKSLRQIPLSSRRTHRFTDAIWDDRRRCIWLASTDLGLLSYQPDLDQWVWHDLQDPFDNTMHTESVLLDSLNGDIWFGHWSGYLGRYEPESKAIQTFVFNPNDTTTLGVALPYRLTHDKKGGILLIGKTGGLSRIIQHESKYIFQNNLFTDRLPGNLLFDIAVDHKANIWAIAANVLYKLSGSGDVQIFDQRYGIDIPPEGSLLFITDKYLAVGLEGRLLRLDPRQIYPNRYPPKLYIQSVKANNQPVYDFVNGYLQKPNLKYKQNNLEIEIGLNSYLGLEKYSYEYRMYQQDTQWISIRDPSSIYLTGLSHGKYRFELKACNESGFCSLRVAAFDFAIAPHFTDTIWFRLVMLLVVLGLFYLFYRYRLAQALQIERVRNKIAADLHDDVASTVSSISYYSEFAQSQVREDQGALGNILNQIGENARESLETMRDVIWSTQSRFDNYGALKAKILAFAQGLCEARNIEFQLNEEGLKNQDFLSPVIRRNLYLIIKEAINNAVRHAECSHIYLTIKKQSQSIHITIRDDGRGLDPDHILAGNGLDNMQQRAHEIHATWDMQTAPGQGTALIVQLPI